MELNIKFYSLRLFLFTAKTAAHDRLITADPTIIIKGSPVFTDAPFLNDAAFLDNTTFFLG